MDMSSATVSSPSSMPARMDMSSMNNVFYNSYSTPLYSKGWIPEYTGSYAGTCIFLIILAIAFRCLSAGKHILEHRWMDRDLNRRYVAVRGTPKAVERIETDDESKKALLVTERGVEEHVKVVKRQTRTIMPWRFSVDLPRAAYTTIMAGVGYLLMVAVMTMNVGYFLSVLAGTFVGELAVGRYAQLDEH